MNDSTTSLIPTLWRTCRVLANRTRLRILGALLSRDDQTVSEMAAGLRLSLPVASRYLRELNARGLIRARRSGRLVFYAAEADRSVRGSVPLLRALVWTFKTAREPIETIFRQATAFTHPRRVTIALALRLSGRTMLSLRETTLLSRRVLERHLRKLERRGFVERDGGKYRLTLRRDLLGRTLQALALQ